jgi:amidophosphoribosyltransferase
VGADIVVPIPDSATNIAIGFGESGRSGKYRPAILRNHYVGRTFIAAVQANRDVEVAQKFTFASELINGASVVVVDDSIVRGTTLPKIVHKMRSLGAREVHVRIGSPPIAHPCRYGVNTPTYEELIASGKTAEEVRVLCGADSLAHLSIAALHALSPEPHTFCYACMDGMYW